MSDKSAIQWTDATWNPTTGCTKVSPGCAKCYIERTPAFRIAGRKFVNGATDLRLHPDRLDQPLHWRKPRRIFVNSLSDLFHPDVPDSFIDRVFAVMTLTPWHTHQVLTKRHERMHAYLSAPDLPGRIDDVVLASGGVPNTVGFSMPSGGAVCLVQRDGVQGWPLRNVWLGPSVENQRMGNLRFPIACELGEAGWNTMVSLEPLLGPVRIPDRYLALGARAWCIPGGESGPGARPCDVAWIRSILAQCQTAGVPCFVKQLGRDLRVRKDSKGGDPAEWPADLRVREYPT